MPSILENSFVNRVITAGSDIVQDVIHVTHPLVHAVEQPITNVFTETKAVGSGVMNMSGSLFRLGVYWMGGWLLWTFVEDVFPSETRQIKRTVDRAWKRARLT